MTLLTVAMLFLILSGCAPASAPTEAPETLALTAPSAPAEAPAGATQPPATLAPPESEDAFVRVQDYIPGILVELRYAGTNNFTGQAVYDFSDAYLRYGTVKKLKKAQDFLSSQNLSLKIWDAYRPVAAQWKLWEIYPDGNFVADPNRTHSSHSRGNTVDLTIVDSQGQELEMPTGFDDFSPLADRDYADCSLVTAENARLLQSIMEQNGFTGYRKEWWHFTDTDSYEVEEAFNP